LAYDLKRFETDLKSVDFTNVAVGAAGGLATDLLVDIPLDAVGLLKSLDLKDADGNHIIGIGTGDVVTIAAGAGLLLGGAATDEKDPKLAKQLREAGLGWLLSFGVAKVSELYPDIMRWWNTVKPVGARDTSTKTRGSPSRKPAGIIIKL